MATNYEIKKGWIKAYRKWQNDPLIMKSAEHFATWMDLNLNANHKKSEFEFGGKTYLINPGQMLTGRKSISNRLKINESKVQRILKCFEKNNLIVQKTTNKNRVITIISWRKDQNNEHQTDQPLIVKKPDGETGFCNSQNQFEQQNDLNKLKNRTPNEQQVNIYNNDKNLKKKKDDTIQTDYPKEEFTSNNAHSQSIKRSGPSRIEIINFISQLGGDKEIAESFHAEFASRNWFTFDHKYIGDEKDWKPKVALRCGIRFLYEK